MPCECEKLLESTEMMRQTKNKRVCVEKKNAEKEKSKSDAPTRSTIGDEAERKRYGSKAYSYFSLFYRPWPMIFPSKWLSCHPGNLA